MSKFQKYSERQEKPKGGARQTKTEIRDAIDAIDRQVVDLLGERMGLALEIGALKRRAGEPVLDAQREQALLAKVRGLSRAPLDGEDVEKIYETIMQVSKRLQQQQG